MKKILLALLCLPSIALAAQQEITAVPDSPVLPSIGALKDAINLRLADIDENFDEIYTAVGTRPWVIQATAPADTTLAWFDTDQVVDAVVLKIHNGERWVPQAIGEGGSYTIPTAAADTLGGVKVGDRLSIADGVLSADVQTTDISGKENSLGNPSTNGYVLASTTAGVRSWVEMTGGGTGIAHAASDGKWYGSKDGGWVDLAPTFSSAVPKWIDMPVGHSFTAGDLAWYNGQVWKASGTHFKVLGEYPDEVSEDWEDYIQAPIVVDYPTEVGVPAWTAEGWAATSYTVGTAANNLVQLNGSAQLPAVSADLLTITDTNGRFTTDTVGAALVQIGEFNASLPSLVFGTGLTLTEDTPSAGTDTISVSANTYQAYDADWLGITPNGAALVSADNYAAMRTLLDLEVGTDFNAYDADLTTWAGVTPGTGVDTALAVNVGAVGGFPKLIDRGTATINSTTLDDASIDANSCAAQVVAISSANVVSTDAPIVTPNAAIDGVTGYGVTTAGALRVDVYPSTGYVNFKVCNPTGAAIAPGEIVLNWIVLR